MRVEMLVTVKDETGEIVQETMGEFVLYGDRIVIMAASDDARRVMAEILDERQLADLGKREVWAAENPAEWMALLPENHTGSRMRARIVDEDEVA